MAVSENKLMINKLFKINNVWNISASKKMAFENYHNIILEKFVICNYINNDHVCMIQHSQY